MVMLRVRRSSDRTLLLRPTRAKADSSVRLLHLSQKYFSPRSSIARFTTSCSRQPTPLRIHHNDHLPPHALILRRSLLTPTRRMPHLRHRARCPPMLVLVVLSRASGQSPPSQGHPRARPVLVVLARCRSASTATPRLESIGLGLSLPLCSKCMFEVFQEL
jgi:hypothetical protein